MKNPLKNNKTFYLLKYRDYAATYKRDGNNANGHPRYEVLIFNQYNNPVGHKNIVSYTPETDIKILIDNYNNFLLERLKNK